MTSPTDPTTTGTSDATSADTMKAKPDAGGGTKDTKTTTTSTTLSTTSDGTTTDDGTGGDEASRDPAKGSIGNIR